MCRKGYRSLFSLILIFCLLLCGCSKKEEPAFDVQSTDDYLERNQPLLADVPQEEVIAKEGGWMGRGGYYTLSLEELGNTLYKVISYGDDIYNISGDFSSNDISKEFRRNKEVLYRSLQISDAAVGSSGIWLLCSSITDANSSVFEYELMKLGETGEILFTMDISKLLEGSYDAGMCVDKNGKLLLLTGENILLFDEEGSYLESIPLESKAMSLISGPKASIYVVLHKENTGDVSIVMEVDTESRTFRKIGEYEGYRIFGGWGEYLFTLSGQDGLYGVVSEKEAPVPVAIWEEFGADFYGPVGIYWLRDGSFIVTDRNMTARLTPGDGENVKRKTVLTMARIHPDTNLLSLVSDFNLGSSEYLIQMMDYSKDGALSTLEALQALQMDIISGNAPDLFDLSGVSQSLFTDNDLLVDLYPFFNEDEEINKEDFILLDKLETDGHLYFVSNSFHIETAVGLYSVVGEDDGISLSRYLELETFYGGDIMYHVTREAFLRDQVYRYAAYSVDWKNKTCDFESEEFLAILNASGSIRENPEPADSRDYDETPLRDRMLNHSLILTKCYVYNVRSYASMESKIGEPLHIVGLPTPDGEGGTRLLPHNLVGICSKGQTKEAWEFVKYMITTGAQKFEEQGISSDREILQRQIDRARVPGEGMLENIALTDEDVEKLYHLLDSAVYYGDASEEVVNIVMEEAAYFLAGDKGTKETAHIIQSRVSLLVAE